MHDPAVSEEVLRYIQQLPRDQCLVAFMRIEKLVVHLGELGIVGSSTPIDAAPTPESAEPPSKVQKVPRVPKMPWASGCPSASSRPA